MIKKKYSSKYYAFYSNRHIWACKLILFWLEQALDNADASCVNVSALSGCNFWLSIYNFIFVGYFCDLSKANASFTLLRILKKIIFELVFMKGNSSINSDYITINAVTLH